MKLEQADYKQKWQRCLDIIRSNIGQTRFDSFFACAEALRFADNRLTISLPSQYFYEKYEDDFYNLLSFALRREFGPEVKLAYEIGGGDVMDSAPKGVQERTVVTGKSATGTTKGVEAAKAAAKPAATFDSQLNAALNFENYCVGESNKLPYTIADYIATNPDKSEFNPFFLYGSVGVGKTHLMQAIGVRIKERNPQAKVLFTTARIFQNLYAHAAMQKTIPSFINWFQQMDVLLLDDLQELAYKVKTTEALFPIFNHLHQNRKQLIFTCDRPPMDLEGIADRLIDRFKWGITEQLPKPDLALRKKIIRFKAAQNNLVLPDDVLDLVAECATSSVRELEGIVMGMLTRSLTLHTPITMSLAREVMRNSVKQSDQKTITFEMIVDAAASYYHLSSDVIYSKSRLRDIADARQIIMYLAHKLTNLSSSAIGQKLNRRHATVLHGIATMNDRRSYAKEISVAIDTIENQLKG